MDLKLKKHALARLSDTQLLLIGGKSDKNANIANFERVYDMVESVWSRHRQLPAQLCGGGGGELALHRVFEISNDNSDRASLIVIGGVIDMTMTCQDSVNTPIKQSKHYAVYDLAY